MAPTGAKLCQRGKLKMPQNFLSRQTNRGANGNGIVDMLAPPESCKDKVTTPSGEIDLEKIYVFNFTSHFELF